MSYVGKLKIGTQVLVSNGQKFIDKKAIVKFVGKLQGKSDEFIGVELQTPDGAHAGSLDGKQYFKTKQNHGMFAKAKAVKLADGSALTTLLTNPQPQLATKTSTTAKTQLPASTKDKAPGVKPKPTTSTGVKKPSQNKLSDQLKQVEVNLQIEALRQQLQSANLKISALQQTDAQQQLIAVRTRLRQLEDQNRMLKVQQEKAKLVSSQASSEKTKELQQKIDFFNSQKDFHQKEKTELKKKIVRLEEQLQTYEGNLEEFEKLTFKNENLEAKNAKLKEQLEAAKTQLRNAQMLGGGSKGGGSSSQLDEMKQLKQNINILNQTLSMVQGDLNQERQKSSVLQKQLQQIKTKGGDVTKLQKKLKSRDQQLQALKSELQASADAANFAQKLTLDMLRKEQSLKQSNSKLSEYLLKIQHLELQISQAKEMIELQTLQLETQEDQIQNHISEKTQQQNHIGQLTKQISKYKSKISQLTQNNESLLNQSQLIDQSIIDDQSTLKPYLHTDLYQQKYFETLKTVQQLSERYLSSQLQSFNIKNTVGVQMLNLVEAIPQSYLQQFYPDITKVIIELKSANDKLYLLFDTAASYMRTRSDIYAKDNIELAKWMVMLIEQIPLLYGQLTKIELSLTTAENQEEISDIVSNTILKELIRRIDSYAAELLHRFAADNIDASIEMDAFIDPVQDLDQICGHGRKLEYEYQTRNKLCVSTMAGVHKLFQSILSFKQKNQVGENAQVDTMIQNLIKSLMTYLRQCCTNPQIRIKTETKKYLEGIAIIIEVLQDLQDQDLTNQLASLYSQNQQIKLFKDTIMTIMFHLKELTNDLSSIVLTSQLSKIKCSLSGKVWIDRAKLINMELGRFHQLTTQKEQLQANLHQAKKKIIILEKDIKDRQATKELYEKRIGQLQLKVQQASSVQKEKQVYVSKIKTYQDTNKLLEDEIQSQINKRKDAEEQIKNLKEKLNNVQIQDPVGKPKQKRISILPFTSGSSNDEVTSLAIFKNVLNQCNNLRTIQLKKKILQIKQSPLIAKLNPQNSQKSQLSNIQAIRRKALNSMCDLKIIQFNKKSIKQANNAQTTIQSLQIQVDEYNFNAPINIVKEQIVEMKIGSFFIRSTKQCQSLRSTVQLGNLKIMSY